MSTIYESGKGPLYRRIHVGSKYVSANYVCPLCGGRTPFPGDMTKLRQYAAEGLLDVRQETTAVATAYVDTAQSFWKAVALWIPATVATVAWVTLNDAPLWILAAEMSVGSAAVFLFAYRTRVVIDPVEEPEEPPEPIRVEAKSERSTFWYNAPSYEKSGHPVPDYKVWAIFDAVRHGVAFSVAGMSPVAGRPAFEAIRNDMVQRGLAYVEGQDVKLKSSGRAVMRAWLDRERPVMTL
jgi:hypothetical protein